MVLTPLPRVEYFPLVARRRAADVVLIEDPAVLEMLFDPLRYRIFRALVRPRSAPELAGEIGEPANRLYYHLRRLERGGLIRRAGERTAGNHVEALWGLAAREIKVSPKLDTSGFGEVAARAVLQNALDELLRAAAAAERGEFGVEDRDYHSDLSWVFGVLGPKRAREFQRRLAALVEEYLRTPDRDDPRRLQYGFLGVLMPVARVEEGDEKVGVPRAGSATANLPSARSGVAATTQQPFSSGSEEDAR